MIDAGIMIVHRDGDIVLWPGAGLAAASAPTVRPLEEAWAGPGPAQCAEHRVTCYTHHTLHATHNFTVNHVHTTNSSGLSTLKHCKHTPIHDNPFSIGGGGRQPIAHYLH